MRFIATKLPLVGLIRP